MNGSGGEEGGRGRGGRGRMGGTVMFCVPLSLGPLRWTVALALCFFLSFVFSCQAFNRCEDNQCPTVFGSVSRHSGHFKYVLITSTHTGLPLWDERSERGLLTFYRALDKICHQACLCVCTSECVVWWSRFFNLSDFPVEARTLQPLTSLLHIML